MPAFNSGSPAFPFPVSPDYRIAALQGVFVDGGPQVWLERTITFSFPSGAAQFANGNDYGKGEVRSGWSPFNAGQQEAARKALAAWSNVANINFVEVPDATVVGDMRFAFTSALTGTVEGSAYYPLSNSSSAGDVWINSRNAQETFSSGSSLSGSSGGSTAFNPVGAANYYVLLHEIGHALGLSHSFTPSGETRNTAALPLQEDNYNYTVMSYTPASALYGGTPTTPMPYDLLAIQYMYGYNTTYNNTNTTYRFDVDAINYQTIWDAGGNDTLVISNLNNVKSLNTMTIDLRPGQLSGIGFASQEAANFVNSTSLGNLATYRNSGVVAMAYNMTIENVEGSNLRENFTGNGANNKFTSGGADDSIDGGSGIDTAIYARPRSDYTLIKTASGFTVTDTFLTSWFNDAIFSRDTLTNVERLQFSDRKLALDLDGNAGTVAKILGAVFGASAVTNKEYVGIGLELADAGTPVPNLVQLALNARLGANASSADIVNLLHQNLFGTAPDTATLNLYTGMLDAGTPASALGAAATNLADNIANIGLVGLATTGLEYI